MIDLGAEVADDCEKMMWHDCKDEDVAVQEWQTCVEAASVVSQRRDAVNGLFVTLSLAIVAAVSTFWDYRALPLLVAGCAMCVAWLLYLGSLKTLNSAKFKVINSIESSLPFAPFKEEWSDVKSRKGFIRGTTIERIMPISFIVLYIAMALLIAFM